jgi:Family of unknown function (DUF6463)
MSRRRSRIVSPGNAIMLLGVGHAGWGLIAYRRELREIARAGVVRSVGDGIFDTEHARGSRAAAFWFMFVAPLTVLAGYLGESALRAGDARAATVAGGTTIGLGVLGAAVMPRSGFPGALGVGYWLLRRGRELR